MKYIKDLINAKSDSSSKRFISLYCLVLFTIVCGCALFGIKVENEIIYGIISLILGTSSMTLISNKSKNEGNINTNSKSDVNNNEGLAG